MATRNEWDSYKLWDGLNIWGAPIFKGGITQEAFTLGDEVTDTVVINGRLATGSVDSAALDIDATYTHDALVELRADVSSWTGIDGVNFYGMYMRVSTSVESADENLYAQQIYAANADGIAVGMMESAIFNTMGKGNSAIAIMRGIEVKCEWLATDTVANSVCLLIHIMGLSAPTNTIFGIEFDKASAAGACATMFHEIKMAAGMHVLSGEGAPSMNAPKGSLYLRTDGSSGTRAYIASDAVGTWTGITTAA